MVQQESQEEELSPTHPQLNPSATREVTVVKETQFRNLPNDISSNLLSEHLSTRPTFSASFTLAEEDTADSMWLNESTRTRRAILINHKIILNNE